MKSIQASCVFLLVTLLQIQTHGQHTAEPYRPLIHFAPAAHWMNDPNGMIYYKGIYHLFFQYYPDSTVWGPMHWGHATSKDLIHWEEKPIALYPDKLGYIFSGSCVADTKNTSGLGTAANPPLVAIYTNHDPNGEKTGKTDYQTQSLAFSLDEGKTWQKYNNNPVLKNPGIKDFRDPKVSWYEAGNKWIMTLATKDRITFYSSPNLKQWSKESEFGQQLGAHGGVWECPDLFPLDYQGKKIWVLLVSINPGGPNDGSATQYFTGSFDGHQFTAQDTTTKWIDYGPDDYAGVTWSGTGDRKIFMGWLSNWNYAALVPTMPGRGSNTLPRDLGIKKVNDNYFLTSTPSKEIKTLQTSQDNSSHRPGTVYTITAPFSLHLEMNTTSSFSIILSNNAGEKTTIGFDKPSLRYYIDRTQSGKTSFANNFSGIHYSPAIINTNTRSLSLYVDASSIELFADNGLNTMTELVYPSTPYQKIEVISPAPSIIRNFTINKFHTL